jgi:hypothetical protein
MTFAFTPDAQGKVKYGRPIQHNPTPEVSGRRAEAKTTPSGHLRNCHAKPGRAYQAVFRHTIPAKLRKSLP